MDIEVKVGCRLSKVESATEYDKAIIAERLEDLLHEVKGVVKKPVYIEKVITACYELAKNPLKEIYVKNCNIIPFAKGMKIREKNELFEITFYKD